MRISVEKFTLTLCLLWIGLNGSLSAHPDRWQCDEDYCPRKCCDNDWLSLDRFSFGIEGLVLEAKEDNLQFAASQHQNYTVIQTIDGIFEETENDKFVQHELNFKWTPGYRIDLAYSIPCTEWNLGFEWTHLKSFANGFQDAAYVVLSRPGNETVLLNNFNSENRNWNTINAHWHLAFNDYILNVGRQFAVCCNFSLAPYIGLKYLDINQSYTLKSFAQPVTTSTSSPTRIAHQKIRSHYRGIGLQGGFTADWEIGCGFGLYSNVGGGITYGRATAHDVIKETREFNFITGKPQTLHESKYNFSDHVSRANLDLALGIEWQTHFCECYLVTLTAGYEYHYYFEQNFFGEPQLGGQSSRGDLVLQGVSFGANVKF